MTTIQRGFAHIKHDSQHLNIHFRCAGTEHKKKAILLHPSPLSSAFMQPMLSMFSDSRHAFAMDTPGNGDSDALKGGIDSLTPLVECLRNFLNAQNIDEALIYGNATGAQIAIEFAKRYPERVEKLVLENAAWFYPEEHQEIFDGYFPSLAPKEDGSHLTLTWKIANQLFLQFPWHQQNDSETDRQLPPLEVIHQTLMDYMKAGDGYAQAYQAALENERPEQLAGVNVSTHIVLWKDSIIYPYCARLQEADLPANIQFHQVASGIENRLMKLSELIAP